MRRIKLILIALIALGAVQGVVAQTRKRSVVETDSTTVVTIVKTKHRYSDFMPKHDIRVGVGTMSLVTTFALDDWGCADCAVVDFRRDIASADTHLTPRIFIGNYTFSYTYHDRRWLQYGGKVVFGASTRWRKDSFTGEKIEDQSRYCFSVMPSVRFNWFYRDAVQLYSTVSIGVVTDFDEAYPWGDLTLVGCSFGRKVFGFVEVGMGTAGWLRGGIGVRFNSVKK